MSYRQTTSYREKKEKARSRNSAISAREVLVIDNKPLRARHFAEAEKVIQKIERLEDKIKLFHSSDQKLFDQWFELTFRKDRKAQEDARNKYQDLARFHNWVVATAHQLDLEMPQAYILMRDEQLRWNAGTAEERAKIEEDRERREAYIRHEFRSRYNEQFSYEDENDSGQDDVLNGGIDGLQQVLDRLENSVFDGDVQHEVAAEDRIARILLLSDQELTTAMDDQEVAFMMFDVALNWGQTHQDYDLFKRLWGLMTLTQRTFFAYVYNSVTDEPIEEFLVGIGLSADFESDTKRNADSDDDDEEDKGPILDDEYIGDPRSGRAKTQAAKTSVVNDEKLKQTFRKLMRKLHPDVYAAESENGETPSWVQRIWNQVQSAYNARNASGLERLLKITLIRMNSLDELTVGEIAEARHWLRKDLETLEEESSGLRSSLAWGFSQKKNFTSLTQKISRELNSQLRELTDQIEELEEQHRLLEALAERAHQPKKSPSRSRRSGTRSGRSARGSRQTQFSFED